MSEPHHTASLTAEAAAKLRGDHTRLTREEVAEREVGATAVSPAVRRACIALFLLTIAAIPVLQHLTEVRRGVSKPLRLKAAGVFQIPVDTVREFLRELGKAPGPSANPDKTSVPGAPAPSAPPAQPSFVLKTWARVQSANDLFLREARAYEKALEDESFLAVAAIPPAQALTAKWLGLGNEQVFVGRNGWLFYQPEVAYLTGEGFLNPDALRTRERAEAVQPNPVKAIVHFRDQLAQRGIRLLLVPAPVKPMLEPEKLSARYDAMMKALPTCTYRDRWSGSYRTSYYLSYPLQNPSYVEFLKALEDANVDYVDVAPVLADEKIRTGQPQFLATDTHWTPAAMKIAAQAVAQKLVSMDGMTREMGLDGSVCEAEMKRDKEALPTGSTAQGATIRESVKYVSITHGYKGRADCDTHTSRFSQAETRVTGVGDIAAMLKLPPAFAHYFPPQEVHLPVPTMTRTVRTGTDDRVESFPPWRADPKAQLLFLGDSFSNIYSLEAMGWGAHAGLVEQVSWHLGGEPIDPILRNDAGAHATRELLANDLRRGRDRLAGKKVVVWEFAMRELAVGDWKMIELPQVKAAANGADAAPAPCSVKPLPEGASTANGGVAKPSNAQTGLSAPLSANAANAPASGFYVPAEGAAPVRVAATVESLSAFPRPGSVPYKDHIFVVVLRNLAAVNAQANTSANPANADKQGVSEGPASHEGDSSAAPSLPANARAIVYLWSMKENVLTPASAWKAGERVTLDLQSWEDVAPKYERFNRSEPADDALQLEPPCWGEPVKTP